MTGSGKDNVSNLFVQTTGVILLYYSETSESPSISKQAVLPGYGLSLCVAPQQGQALGLQDLEPVTGRGGLQGAVHAEDNLETTTARLSSALLLRVCCRRQATQLSRVK